MKVFCIKFSLFVLSLVAINYAVVWVYEMPKRDAISKGTYGKFLKWNDVKKPDTKYKAVILGSSRGYCAYNPQVIDSITGIKSYNMCTGSQNVVESYYILKEVLKYQHLKFVVYETFLPSFKATPDYFHVLENAQFMSTNGKLNLVLCGFGAEGIFNMAFPVLKYKYYFQNELFNGANFKKTNSTWIKGYLHDTTTVDKNLIEDFNPIYSFENTNVSRKDIAHYTHLLHELCKQNSIELIATRAPYPPSRLKLSSNDEVHDYFKTLYATQGINYYDFNYDSSKKYYDTDFSDHHHMNSKGADKVSVELANILMQ